MTSINLHRSPKLQARLTKVFTKFTKQSAKPSAQPFKKATLPTRHVSNSLLLAKTDSSSEPYGSDSPHDFSPVHDATPCRSQSHNPGPEVPDELHQDTKPQAPASAPTIRDFAYQNMHACLPASQPAAKLTAPTKTPTPRTQAPLPTAAKLANIVPTPEQPTTSDNPASTGAASVTARTETHDEPAPCELDQRRLYFEALWKEVMEIRQARAECERLGKVFAHSWENRIFLAALASAGVY